MSASARAGVFEPLGYGAAAKGMGGAYTALAQDGSAAYWNPAGLALVEDAQFTGSLEDIQGLDLLRYGTLGYTHPRIGGGALSAQILHLDTVGAADFLKYAESTYLVAYGRKVCQDCFSLGAGMRYYSALADGTRGTGLGFDVGALFRPWDDRVRVGIAWQDLNRPRIDWYTGARDRLPYTVRTSGALRVNRRMDTAIQFDQRYGESGVWRGGLSHKFFREAVVLRGGLHRGGDQEEWGLALGGGVRVGNLSVDYAWDTQDPLGNSQNISIALRLGR